MASQGGGLQPQVEEEPIPPPTEEVGVAVGRGSLVAAPALGRLTAAHSAELALLGYQQRAAKAFVAYGASAPLQLPFNLVIHQAMVYFWDKLYIIAFFITFKGLQI